VGFKRVGLVAPLLLCSLAAAFCGKSDNRRSATSSPTLPGLIGPSAPFAPTGVMVGAGDIAMCGTGGSDKTARLLDSIGGTVFTTGDNVYMRGTAAEFANCYEPSWGRHRSRTRPAPGNHEYESGAAGYFGYFGASAGGAGEGFYSYGVGPWRIYALNSEISSASGSPQAEWLRRELASRPAACTAAYWHRPLFSSGMNGDNPDMRDLWRILYEANVDIVINGHDHIYERFSPQDPDGRPDQQRGIRQFIIGTGGAMLYPFATVRSNSETRAAAWGVTMFTLMNGSYQWEFVPVEGGTFRDAGSGTCH
jgi:hypothetical protein